MQTLGPLFGSARHTHPAAPGGQRLAQSVSAEHGAGMGGGGHCGGGGSAHTPSLHLAAGAPGGAYGGALQSVAAAHFTMHTLGPLEGSARQMQPIAEGQPLPQSPSLAQGGGRGGPGGRDGRHAPSRHASGGMPAACGQSVSAAQVGRHLSSPRRPARHAQPAEPVGQAFAQSESELHGAGPPPGGPPGGRPHGGCGAGSAAAAAS
jgi:hypothetical protein